MPLFWVISRYGDAIWAMILCYPRDVAVTIDNSGGNLTPHFYIPPAEIKNQTLGWCLMLVACSAVKVPHVIREPLVCSEQ